jgi:Tfp pilus assembly protein PilV
MKRKNEHGSAWIETVIALLVVTGVLLAIGSLLWWNMHSTYKGDEVTTAAKLAQKKMERLGNIPFDSLKSGNDSVRLGNINYARQWSVSATGNIAILTVTIIPSTAGSRPITFTTLRGE